MAEKPGELNSVDKLDPISATAGTGTDSFLEKYSEDDDVRELAPTTDGEADETGQIRAQIEETRNQMGETIDAIQERLSFANISEQVSETVSNAIETAKDTAYDATIGKAVNFMKNVGDGVTRSDAFKTVRRNPFPFALIGIGAGLLAYQSFGGGRSRYGNGRKLASGDPDRFQGEQRSSEGTFGKAANEAFEGVADRASSAYESVAGAAGSAYENVSEKLSSAYSEAGELAHRAYDRVGEYGTVAHEKYDQLLEDNPLALGAIAIAAGAAVGFVVPSTRYEGKLMGEARETVMQQVQDAAGSFVDKAKQVAAEAGQTIKNETASLTQ
jgi:ElaB/YqjD/DUF883 family membrane-anchored ribosome-binding protein